MSETLERLIVGTLVQQPGATSRALAVGLKAEHLQMPSRREIVETILGLANAGVDFDFVTLGSHVAPALLGELVECTGAASPSQDIAYYVSELIAEGKAQQLAVDLSRLANAIQCRKPFEVLGPAINDAHQMLERARGDLATQSGKRAPEIVDAVLNDLERRMIEHDQGKTRGIKTELRVVDEEIGGLRPGKLIVLSARTSVGKTTMACNLALAAIRMQKATAFFSVEMTPEEIGEKILSNMSGINQSYLDEGDLDSEKLDRLTYAAQQLYQMPLAVYSKFQSSLAFIEAEARRLRRLGQCDLLVVDYLQQMKIEQRSKNHHVDIGEVSARLKALSLELGIPVLAVAQLNREAVGNKDGPQLSHIRDSGAIEQDADIVLLLHRDEEGEYPEHYLIVAKNRGGRLGRYRIGAELSLSRFKNASL